MHVDHKLRKLVIPVIAAAIILPVIISVPWLGNPHLQAQESVPLVFIATVETFEIRDKPGWCPLVVTALVKRQLSPVSPPDIVTPGEKIQLECWQFHQPNSSIAWPLLPGEHIEVRVSGGQSQLPDIGPLPDYIKIAAIQFRGVIQSTEAEIHIAIDEIILDPEDKLSAGDLAWIDLAWGQPNANSDWPLYEGDRVEVHARHCEYDFDWDRVYDIGVWIYGDDSEWDGYIRRLDGQPDLTFNRVGFNKPEPFEEDDVIWFGAEIVNQGSINASSFQVELYLDDQLYDSGTLSLGSGESTTLWAEYLWTATPGSHTVTWIADTTDVVVESNEYNNEMSRTFTVGGTLESTVLFIGEMVSSNLAEKYCYLEVSEILQSVDCTIHATKDVWPDFIEVEDKELSWESGAINKEIRLSWDADAISDSVSKIDTGTVVEVLSKLRETPAGEIYAELKTEENTYLFIVPGVFFAAHISNLVVYRDYDPFDETMAANVFFKIDISGVDDDYDNTVDEEDEYVRLPTLDDSFWERLNGLMNEIEAQDDDVGTKLAGPFICREANGVDSMSCVPIPLHMEIEVRDEDAWDWDDTMGEFEVTIDKAELEAAGYTISKSLGSKEDGVSFDVYLEPLMPRDTHSYTEMAESDALDLGLNYFDVNGLDAYEDFKTGACEEVRVGVIEWGCPDLHQEWDGCVKEVWDFVGGKWTAVTPGVETGIGDSHASMTSGIVISNIDGQGAAGLAWNAKLIIIAAERKELLGEAIKLAVDRGAKVINLSISGSSEAGVESAVKYAIDHDVVLVAAAGNAFTSKVFIPQRCDPVIKVGGVTRIEKLVPPFDYDEHQFESWFGLFFCNAPYSNYGKYASFDTDMKLRLDFSVPSTICKTTDLGGSYQPGGGTSAAAPLLASIVALIQGYGKAKHGRYLTINEAYEVLKQASEDLGDPGWDPYYGWGVVDVRKALDVVSKQIPTPTVDITTMPSPSSETGITLSSEGAQLFLNIYDKQGNMLFGIDKEAGEVVLTLEEAEYEIGDNSTCISLPFTASDLRVIVDGESAHQETERAEIEVTSLREGEVVDQEKAEFTIKKKTTIAYDISTTEDGEIQVVPRFSRAFPLWAAIILVLIVAVSLAYVSAFRRKPHKET